MQITEHAIDMYISRVIGVSPRQAGESIRKRAANKIYDTVDNPDSIHKSTDEDIPIYIRGGAAIPVGKDPDGELYVPTTYHSKTFSEDDSKDGQLTAG